MAYKFLDTLLDSSPGARTKRKLTLPVSIGIHVVVLAVVLLVPLLTFSELPEPVMSGAIRAFLVEAAPPPPPPPPPPPMAASAPRTVTQPKIEQPKPVTEEPKFTAPIETPREIPKQEEVSGLAGLGEPGGEIGGVAGGVSGGSEGGVVGGTIGGVAGGELGGMVGGVVGAVAPAEPPPPPVPSGPVRVGGQIKAPSKLSNSAPVYPAMAKQARVEGTVILEATISAQGRVTDVKVLRGIPLLDNAAVDAVRQWHYSPTRLNGTPVPVIMTVTVNFRLGADGRSAPAPAKASAPAAAPVEAPAPPAEAAPETVPPPSR